MDRNPESSLARETSRPPVQRGVEIQTSPKCSVEERARFSRVWPGSRPPHREMSDHSTNSTAWTERLGILPDIVGGAGDIIYRTIIKKNASTTCTKLHS